MNEETSVRDLKDAGEVSNTLLDVVGPLVFAPLVAVLFWNHTTTTRILIAAGLHATVTIIFALVLWWGARNRPQRLPQLEEVWTASSGLAAGALPWILAPSTSAGQVTVALTFAMLLASDTLFLAVRPSRRWTSIATLEVASFSVYLVTQQAWVMAGFCLVFGFHLVGGYQAIQDLVSLLRSEREESDRMANTDYLTGLNNRRGLARYVDRKESDVGEEWQVASIDIDNFKQVNDRYGHDGGDQAIIGVSEAVRERLGEDWTLARVGGDEFLAVSSGKNLASIETLLDELQLQIAGQTTVPITMSIGVASGPLSDDLWKDASAGLRLAKAQGKNRVQRVDDPMRVELRGARDIAGRLEAAISERRIVMWAQPIVRVADGEVHSYECLARWIEPDGTLIPPNVFIPMVEDQSLTRHMGESVIAQAAEFATQLPPEISVGVNISASHFVDGSLPSYVHRVLERTQIAPAQMTIEITESEYFAGESDWLAIARQLRELGVGLSIDDFGSGYSSLERLMQLPFTQLKLDRILVAASMSAAAQHLIAGMNHYARSGGVELVAEGVEDEAQHELLRSLGVELAQGFLFARPQPLDAICAEYDMVMEALTSPPRERTRSQRCSAASRMMTSLGNRGT